MPRDRADCVTAVDRIAAEKIIAAVAKKDVDALATELAWHRAQAVMVALLRVERTFGIARLSPLEQQTRADVPAKDPRQKEMFDDG